MEAVRELQMVCSKCVAGTLQDSLRRTSSLYKFRKKEGSLLQLAVALGALVSRLSLVALRLRGLHGS